MMVITPACKIAILANFKGNSCKTGNLSTRSDDPQV